MQISTKYHEKTNLFHQNVAKEKRISEKRKKREFYQKAIENAHFDKELQKNAYSVKKSQET